MIAYKERKMDFEAEKTGVSALAADRLCRKI